MRPFVISEELQLMGYNLDRCEETLLVDAWMKIRSRIPAEETWAQRFEDKFFNTEKGVSGADFDNINRHLRRLKMAELDFAESDWTPYMRLRHQERIDARAEIKADILSSRRAGILVAANQELATLPPLRKFDTPEVNQEAVMRRRREDALMRARQEEERIALESQEAEQNEAGRALEIAAELKKKAEDLVEQASAAVGVRRHEGEALGSPVENLLMRIAAAVEGLNAKMDRVVGGLENRMQTVEAAIQTQPDMRESPEKKSTTLTLGFRSSRSVTIPQEQIHLADGEQPDISHLNGHAFHHDDNKYVPTARYPVNRFSRS